MFVGWETNIDSRNRDSERARDLPRAHRILGSHGALGDKRKGERLLGLGVPAVRNRLYDLSEQHPLCASLGVGAGDRGWERALG